LGCATGGAAGGGDTDLPNRGFVPYEKLRDADGAVVRVVEGLDAPCAVVEGEALWLYLEDCEGACRVVRVRSEDGVRFTAPEEVVASGRAPFVVGESMAYVDGEGRVVVDGVTTEVRGEAPSLAGEHLFFVREGALWRAGLGGMGAERVMGGGTGCVDARDEETRCWDAGGIVDAEVRISTGATGRSLYRVVYTAEEGGVGFAASADGRAWSRFAFNPVFEDRARSPTNVRFGDVFALYFAAGRAQRFVVAAFNDQGAPSESF